MNFDININSEHKTHMHEVKVEEAPLLKRPKLVLNSIEPNQEDKSKKHKNVDNTTHSPNQYLYQPDE
jgi:hypothetical protein